MTLHYEEPHQRDIDWMVKLASKNVCDGVIEEPRVVGDEITLLDPAKVTRGHADVFTNGEQFPIRLTHVSMALLPDFDNNVGLDERFIQRVGARLTFHDQFYMSRNFVPAPLWANKVVAAGDANTQGTTSHIYDRPNILSARDSLRIMVQLNQTPASPRLVSCAVTGVGMLSKRPYFFSDTIEVSDQAPTQLSTEAFRNDGTEPVAITDMSFSCGAELDDPSAEGDIRQLRVQVRQVGNGTQADWYQGPRVPSPVERCPAVLLGYGTGRSIVHRFPGDGLIWEPGEGILLDMQALDPSVVGMTAGLSLYGYIAVI